MLDRPDVAALGDPDAKVDRLFRLAYGRAPRDEEASLARAFLGRPAGPLGGASARRSCWPMNLCLWIERLLRSTEGQVST